MMVCGRMKMAAVVIVVASLSAGCDLGAGKTGTAGAMQGVSTKKPTSVMPARQLSVPSDPCGLLTPSMALGLYPSVATPGTPDSGPGIVECVYDTPDGSAAHVERVHLEVITQDLGRQAGGSNFQLPRALAQSIASNPTSSGDSDAHFIDLDAPGDQTVFLDGNRSGGGSEQSIRWLHGNLVVSLETLSDGTTGYTASLQSILLADARMIDAGLG
jgi:hypothetical protein